MDLASEGVKSLMIANGIGPTPNAKLMMNMTTNVINKYKCFVVKHSVIINELIPIQKADDDKEFFLPSMDMVFGEMNVKIVLTIEIPKLTWLGKEAWSSELRSPINWVL